MSLRSGVNGSLTLVFKRIHILNSEKEKGPQRSSLILPNYRESAIASKQSTQSDRSSNSAYGNPLEDSYAASQSPAKGEGEFTGPEPDKPGPDCDVP